MSEASDVATPSLERTAETRLKKSSLLAQAMRRPELGAIAGLIAVILFFIWRADSSITKLFSTDNGKRRSWTQTATTLMKFSLAVSSATVEPPIIASFFTCRARDRRMYSKFRAAAALALRSRQSGLTTCYRRRLLTIAACCEPART